MKIKGRLITAFLIIIMIPVILISTSVGFIINYQVNSIQECYDVESNTLQILTNPMQVLNRLTRGVYNEIKVNTLREPGKFQDREYVEELNKELEKKYSFLAVRKDNEFIFAGNQEKLKTIEELLPGFGVYVTDAEGGLYMGDQNPFLIKKQDFNFEDGGEGSVFVITEVDTLLPQIKASAVQMVISFILIICLTAIILTAWIYQGLLRPLNALRMATNRMKEGDLDFSIAAESDDEIGMLCEDFEDMRVRLKELIEVRMQYEEESRELISNISHDLKTPLTAIKGYAEGIMDGVADTPDKMERYLKTIYNKANDMTVLVDELSIYSKIDCNSIPYTFRKVNLDRYFNDCINDIKLDLEVKNIDLVYFNYTDSTLEVAADVEQLKRVINNIINNSVKYIGKKKGIINIRIQDAGDIVEIQFEDNGKGIARDELPNIFDRFYRTDASRNSSQVGSGLGLSIAKKIIEDHGGKIWAESKENVGTSIFFTLRKAEASAKREEEPEEACVKNSFGLNIGKIKM